MKTENFISADKFSEAMIVVHALYKTHGQKKNGSTHCQSLQGVSAVHGQKCDLLYKKKTSPALICSALIPV